MAPSSFRYFSGLGISALHILTKLWRHTLDKVGILFLQAAGKTSETLGNTSAIPSMLWRYRKDVTTTECACLKTLGEGHAIELRRRKHSAKDMPSSWSHQETYSKEHATELGRQKTFSEGRAIKLRD